MATQWHPIFAKVLRPLVEKHYDVETNLPVGDAPREADIALLRRTSQRRPPFRGLWRHLTQWNVFEFKGRSASARVYDLNLLVEVGLGIARRLNEQRARDGESFVPAPECSFWYLANELGSRFLRDAEQLLGPLEPLTTGVWRCQVLRHLVFLVSSVAAPVERDTTPPHLLAKESLDTDRELARVIVEEPGLWEIYAPFLNHWHNSIWEEAKRMARAKGKSEDEMDLRPFIDSVGLDQVIASVGLKQVVKAVGVKQLVEEVGIEAMVKEIGIEAMLKEIGTEAVLKKIGTEAVLKEIGIEGILSHLTPAQLRELQKRTAKRG